MAKKTTSNLKALLLLLFILAALLIFSQTGLQEFLAPQILRDMVAQTGRCAPLIFIVIYGLGICAFLPASFFTAVGAMLFGLGWGFVYNFAGGLLGASLSFMIGRYLGRDFAAGIIGSRLQVFDDKLRVNGFKTTLYLRLAFCPFTALNYGLALTAISFRQFFWGTFFGKIAGGFILTFFFASLTEIWISGRWIELWGWQNVLAVLLFIASFFIPRVAKHLKLFRTTDGHE